MTGDLKGDENIFKQHSVQRETNIHRPAGSGYRYHITFGDRSGNFLEIFRHNFRTARLCLRGSGFEEKHGEGYDMYACVRSGDGICSWFGPSVWSYIAILRDAGFLCGE